MTATETEEFLAADRNAVLATNGADGIPQLTPVWFLYEDGLLYVSAQTDLVGSSVIASSKTKYVTGKQVSKMPLWKPVVACTISD